MTQGITKATASEPSDEQKIISSAQPLRLNLDTFYEHADEPRSMGAVHAARVLVAPDGGALLVRLLDLTHDPTDRSDPTASELIHPVAVSLRVERAAILELSGTLLSAAAAAFKARRVPPGSEEPMHERMAQALDVAPELGMLRVDQSQAELTADHGIDLYVREVDGGRRILHLSLTASLARHVGRELKAQFRAAGGTSGLIDMTAQSPEDLRVEIKAPGLVADAPMAPPRPALASALTDGATPTDSTPDDASAPPLSPSRPLP